MGGQESIKRKLFDNSISNQKCIKIEVYVLYETRHDEDSYETLTMLFTYNHI